MVKHANIRPGRSSTAAHIRHFANVLRSWLYFMVKAPWVVRKGMIRIPWNVELWSPHHDITLGNRVQFGPNCIIHCDASVGDSVLVARNVAFLGRDDHRYDIVGKTIWDSPRGDSCKVIIEDDVWVGHGAIIIAGATIGRGSVVAAGSVVVKDVPPYSIVGGVPGKVIGKRFTDQQIIEHEKIMGGNE